MIKNQKLLKVKEFRREERMSSYYRNVHSGKKMRVLVKMEDQGVWISVHNQGKQ